MVEASDRTAFPWCPVTKWQKENRGPDKPARWIVRIVNPEPHPQYMKSVTGTGLTPSDAIGNLLMTVSWWLDYDGRRKGTVAEVYGTGR